MSDYGVNIPGGLDRKVKKLEKMVALLMEERKERMDAEKANSTVEITEELKIKPDRKISKEMLKKTGKGAQPTSSPGSKPKKKKTPADALPPGGKKLPPEPGHNPVMTEVPEDEILNPGQKTEIEYASSEETDWEYEGGAIPAKDANKSPKSKKTPKPQWGDPTISME